MRSKLRSSLINWALFISVLVLGVAAIEWIFRSSSLGDQLGWVAVKSVEERVLHAPLKSTNKFRILGLGDSFTIYRDSRGKNYLRIMESLAQKDGYSVELINLARPGTGLNFYEAVARQYIGQLKPDLVTVGLYLGDDIPERVLPESSVIKPAPKNLKDTIKNYSRFTNYAFRLLKQHVPALHSGEFDKLIENGQKKYHISDQILAERRQRIDHKIVELAKSDAINPWDLVNGLIVPDRFHNLIMQNPQSQAPRHIDALFQTLMRLKNFLDGKNIPVVFMTIPIRLQVSLKDQIYFERLGVKTGPELIGNTPLQKTISRRMRTDNLHHFDLLPALQAAGGKLFIPMDTHLNNAGQVVAGTHLYQYLKKLNILVK